MSVSNYLENYFTGFYEISNYNKNDSSTNLCAIAKIVSYFLLVPLIVVGAAYGIASLIERVTVKTEKSDHDRKIAALANQHLNGNEDQVENEGESEEGKNVKKSQEGQNANANNEDGKNVKTQEGQSSSKTAEVNKKENEDRTFTLEEVLSAYIPRFTPAMNRKNLEAYSKSGAYERHAKTAQIYYNAKELTDVDALDVIYHREPTNIENGQQYNKAKLNQMFGYEQSVYNDPNAIKTKDGKPFSAAPNTACVYSETFLWPTPGQFNEKEIACLSVPAPALDSVKQPHYQYYMANGSLDKVKYQNEIHFLFCAIRTAIHMNREFAFQNEGFKRIVLCRFGQSAFLNALKPADQQTANQIFRNELQEFLNRVKGFNIPVVMSEYSNNDISWHSAMLKDGTLKQTDFIVGDILKTAQQGDFIVNAWDPHSAPGNGNDADRSFDGAMGRGTGILLTQTAWLNKHLRSRDALQAIIPSLAQ